jgi:hypothetical protein
MTHDFQSTTTHEAVQLLAEHGFDSMAQAIQILMNEAMKTERAEYLERGFLRTNPGKTHSREQIQAQNDQ